MRYNYGHRNFSTARKKVRGLHVRYIKGMAIRRHKKHLCAMHFDMETLSLYGIRLPRIRRVVVMKRSRRLSTATLCTKERTGHTARYSGTLMPRWRKIAGKGKAEGEQGVGVGEAKGGLGGGLGYNTGTCDSVR